MPTLSPSLSPLAAIALTGAASTASEAPGALPTVSGVAGANPSGGNAIDVPRAIFEMVMRGITPEEVATITGLGLQAVEKVLLSQWFEAETTNRAKSANSEEPESLRSLLRVQAFRAAVKLGKFLDHSNANIALGAIKTCLEYAIKPMRLVDIDKSKGVGTMDDVQKEISVLEHKLSVLDKRAR